MESSLIYINVTWTRPELNSDQVQSHPIHLIQVLQYIKQIDNQMTFCNSPSETIKIHACCYANWDSSLYNRCIISSNCISLTENDLPIRWQPQKTSIYITLKLWGRAHLIINDNPGGDLLCVMLSAYPTATLGHSQGDSITNPILINVLSTIL